MYTVRIEAQGYDPEEDAGRLIDAVEELAPEDTPVLEGSDRMLMMVVSLEAPDALDAYAEGFAVWEACWQRAFPDMPPPRRFAVTAVPAEVAA